MTFDHWIQILNLIILAATGLVVWLYTRAAQRSNEIQEEPLLSLSFKDTTPSGNSSKTRELRIKNIGRGPAFNISVEPFLVQSYSYRFYLKNPALEPAELNILKMFVKTPEGGTEISDMMWFLTRQNPKTFNASTLEEVRKNPAIFVLHYQGTSGKIYYSAFALYSTLPPSGDIVVQFLVRGVGTISLEKAKGVWETSNKIKPYVQD